MTLRDAIINAIKELTFLSKDKGYHWDTSSGIGGSVGDLVWDGKTIMRGHPEMKTYCCGITLQAYLMACEQIGKHIDYADVLKIKRAWFVQFPREPVFMNKGPVDSLVPRFAREIPIDQVQEGDFAQIWRRNGSGHSIAPVAFFTENGVKALKYWSSQPSTNGPGYRTEYFEGVQNPITHVWACRPL